MMTPLRSLCSLLLAVTASADGIPVSDPESGPRRGAKGTVQIATINDRHVALWRESSRSADWLDGAVIARDGAGIAEITAVRSQQALPNFPGRIAGGDDRVLIPGMCSSPFSSHSVCIQWLDLATRTFGPSILIAENAIVPSAAWNGEVFLLTYATSFLDGYTLQAREITIDGNIGPPIDLGPLNRVTHTPPVTAAGRIFYVAWHDTANAARLTAIRDGEVDSSELLDAPAGRFMGPQLALAGAGDEVMVVTQHGDARLYGPAGPRGDWFSIADGEVHHLRAVRTNAEWTFIFATGGANDYQIRARSMHGVETVLAQTQSFIAFDVAESNGGYLLAWASGRDMLSQEFDAAGRPASATGMLSIGVADQSSPAAAFGGNAYLVAWSERNGDRWQIRARRFSVHGEALGPPIVVAPSARDQVRPFVDFNGESFLIVWTEGIGGQEGVRSVRVGADGVVLDPTAIEVAGSAVADTFIEGTPRTATVSWSGTSWLIASESTEGIELRRLTANAVLLDAQPVVVRLSSLALDRQPVVDCSEQGSCLVAWHTYIPRPCPPITCPRATPDSVVFVRVSNDLQILDAAPVALSEPLYGPMSIARNLSVVWNALQDAWLVSWLGGQRRRIARTGEILDPAVRSPFWFSWGSSAAAERRGWRLIVANVHTGHPDSASVMTGWVERGGDWEDVQARRRVAPLDLPFDTPDVHVASGPRSLLLFEQAAEAYGGASRILLKFVEPYEASPRRRSAGRAPQ